MTDHEFIIVTRDMPGSSFRYRVYVVPTGEGWRHRAAQHIDSADTLWGAHRAIRKERRRRALGPEIVHREPA